MMDAELFWKLLEPEHDRAQAFCRKLTGDIDNGDDLYQDALVKALSNFDALRDRQAFRPWLYRIIVNRYKTGRRRSLLRIFSPITPEIEESIGGDNPSLAFAARRKLQLAFQAVSAEERALIILFELEGWSIAELADLRRKSEGAIKVRLSRIRKRMRQALAGAALNDRSIKNAFSEDKICVATKPETD